MLTSLSIRNYAIIKDLHVEFNAGFCVITGETGAGKSIILGALSLILGQRADITALKNVKEKCVVEGKFSNRVNPAIKFFFDRYELDYDETIILRREITQQGKSRAFINDTPVQLPVIRELGLMLIDIHSQHSNLELSKHQFQLNVLDWFGNHSDLITSYQFSFNSLKKLENELETFRELAEKSKADLDYFEFQFNQLEELKLIPGEQEKLEEEQEMLSHAEEIKSGLNDLFQLYETSEFSINTKLREVLNVLAKLKPFFPQSDEFYNRVESQLIEARDLSAEFEVLSEKIEFNPVRLEEISQRLDAMYSLFQKHRVQSVDELVKIRDEFDQKIQESASYDLQIEELSAKFVDLKIETQKIANLLHDQRDNVIPEIENEVKSYLQQLGMPNALFSIKLIEKEELTPTGIDEVNFLFSANKGVLPEEINKVASGGELSRLMLAIKTVIARSKALPAIIFDEIDSGISGEIAAKMAEILKSIAQYMQVINITHLPQIASKGDTHYRVFKLETEDSVETGMRILTPNERIEEIAKMLSGENPSPEAFANAKSLLIS
jgi:DNA repair protein RecN (Recombination protein N)